jgi:hypothetical protein
MTYKTTDAENGQIKEFTVDTYKTIDLFRDVFEENQDWM